MATSPQPPPISLTPTLPNLLCFSVWLILPHPRLELRGYYTIILSLGYMSGRLYRTLRGQQWKSAAFWTATLYPGYIFCIGFFLNIFVWGQDSSSAVPIPTMLALFALWFCVSLPLTFIGYYFGFRKQAYEHPVRTNQIPRQVRLW